MENFDFTSLPKTSGGKDYTSHTLRIPGDDRIHWSNARHRALGVFVDVGVPVMLFWQVIDRDFFAYLLLTAVVLNSVVLQGKTGRSVGKFVAGTRLAYIPQDMRLQMKVTCCYPGVGRCAARFVLHVFDWILLLGFVRCLWNVYSKSFADSMCKTAVVWDRRVHFWTVDEYREEYL